MPLTPLVIAIGMLVLGATNMPFGYYTLLRIVACTIFGWAAYIAFTRRSQTLPWLYGLIAVLFNPLVKVSFSKPIWAALDIGAAVFLIVTARFIVSRRHR